MIYNFNEVLSLIKEDVLNIKSITLKCSTQKYDLVYEYIINLKNTDWEYIHKEDLLQYCVNEGGHWQWFVSIVNKYGLMPITNLFSYNSSTCNITKSITDSPYNGATCAHWILKYGNMDYKYRDVSSEW